MKIIKPLRLGILHRPYYEQGVSRLGVAILALVDMGDKPLLRPETELWPLAKNELTASGGIIDLAYPKHFAEFLATGHAWPHDWLEQNVCRVSIALGDKQKSLIVSGDREWLGEHPSAARPFTSLPLDWRRTWGGPACADNPLGMGAATEDDGRRPRPLPNIEAPDSRLTSPTQQIVPASFDAIDITHPARQALMGSQYDEEWIKQGMQGFAADASPRLFNMASRDQQWDDASTLAPGLPYRIQNMHPHKALLEGKLPDWHARCFMHATQKGEEQLSEIALGLTTVWFLPHLEKMILVYHGSTPVEEDDAHNVHMLMPALESLATPRPLSHYRDVWIKRSDKEKGAVYAFQEDELLPEDAIGAWIDTDMAPPPTSPLEQNLQTSKQAIYQDMEQRLVAVNRPLPDSVKTAPTVEHPTLAQLPGFMAQLEERARTTKSEAMEQANRRLSAEHAAYAEQRPAGPDVFYKLRDAVREQQGELQPGQEEQLYQVYRLGVTGQDAAPRLEEPRRSELRQWVIHQLAQERDFTGCDLTGADLSGLDFSAANLTRAMLENADLNGTILDNAILTQTLLARAQLHRTSLRNAVLHDTTLALANCSDCDFSGSTINGLISEGAQFERCNFAQATLSDLVLDNVAFTDCQFSAAMLNNVIVTDCTLENAVLTGARLHKCNFSDSQLTGAVFTQAHLERCSVSRCAASESDFSYARLQNCAFVAATSLEKASFNHAILHQCSLRQTPLAQADLSFCQLENCDLSEAELNGANLCLMQASDTLFIRARLEDASLRQSSLMGCRLQKSRLIGSDFTGANLFRADISQAQTDDTTRMDNAWLKQAKIYPLYKGVE
ncbi:DUF2169 domain-containing protein [Enterobacteriaceae bacterium 4M9]|nr:DUF2169 domain-containing protein [Enterobacteriaceae bacterium 4M9]